MRLWTVHPKYLDAKGLVALWREGLLAKAVLEGKTKGYRNHPQLLRFMEQDDPEAYITEYLRGVLAESKLRGYKFDKSKLQREAKSLPRIQETNGQLEYEWNHLLKKLKERDPSRYDKFSGLASYEHHGLFDMVPGEIRSWEKVN